MLMIVIPRRGQQETLTTSRRKNNEQQLSDQEPELGTAQLVQSGQIRSTKTSTICYTDITDTHITSDLLSPCVCSVLCSNWRIVGHSILTLLSLVRENQDSNIKRT